MGRKTGWDGSADGPDQLKQRVNKMDRAKVMGRNEGLNREA
jgi:hypothetical protein